MKVLYDMRSGVLVKSNLYINNLNIADAINKDYILAMIGSTQLFIGSTETLIGVIYTPKIKKGNIK